MAKRAFFIYTPQCHICARDEMNIKTGTLALKNMGAQTRAFLKSKKEKRKEDPQKTNQLLLRITASTVGTWSRPGRLDAEVLIGC
jgi:hypothetical protein